MVETYYHKSDGVWIELGSHSIGSGVEKGTSNSLSESKRCTHYDENPARGKIYSWSATRRMMANS